MPNDELTYRQRERILKEVILGGRRRGKISRTPRRGGTSANATWRRSRRQGGMPEIPFDPTYDD